MCVCASACVGVCAKECIPPHSLSSGGRAKGGHNTGDTSTVSLLVMLRFMHVTLRVSGTSQAGHPDHGAEEGGGRE